MAKTKAAKPRSKKDLKAATKNPAAQGAAAKKAAAKKSSDSSKLWSVLSVGAALVAANVAKKGLSAGWKAATGKEPPANPADPDVQIWEAVLWAAFSGTLVQLARMLAQRRAANYYARSAGHLPPPLQKD